MIEWANLMKSSSLKCYFNTHYEPKLLTKDYQTNATSIARKKGGGDFEATLQKLHILLYKTWISLKFKSSPFLNWFVTSWLETSNRVLERKSNDNADCRLQISIAANKSSFSSISWKVQPQTLRCHLPKLNSLVALNIPSINIQFISFPFNLSHYQSNKT